MFFLFLHYPIKIVKLKFIKRKKNVCKIAAHEIHVFISFLKMSVSKNRLFKRNSLFCLFIGSFSK
ncbi:hypothetical protein TPHV1_120068 [Treponema phagedenis]|uniref:Uncharacterized protein n=1 Tax=Treponema phagedenis TaxID=162 RepID=A0A0B7GQS8_TREPH|nr:hypothetical protein TPHV1_120068 [Treponema phagedenis]